MAAGLTWQRTWRHGAAALSLLLAGVRGSVGQETLSLAEAVQQTLASSPGVRLQAESVAAAQGQLRAASGQFDWLLAGHVERLSVATPTLTATGLATPREDQELYRLNLTRQFRSGIAVSPGVSVQRADALRGPAGPYDVSASALSLVVPLQRGRGETATAADEQAARVEVAAALEAQAYGISAQVAATGYAFYACLAAREELAIRQAAEELTMGSMAAVRAMITAAMLDPADLLQARAVVASKQAQRRAAEALLQTRRFQLGAAMGYPPDQVDRTPMPSGTFPEPVSAAELARLNPADCVRRSLVHRGDLAAARQRLASADILLAQARQGLRPQLDLDLQAGYAGYREEGRLASTYSDLSGPNVQVGLRLGLPVKNDMARGYLATRHAARRQAEERAAQLASQIGAEILAALEDLRAGIDQYRLVADGEAIFQQAFTHEQKKLSTGASSLSDVLQLQDRYTDVRLARVAAMEACASALIRLRLVTGTLLERQGEQARLDVDRLVQLPYSELRGKP
jgi:outer membrane protein TolC